MLIKIINSIRIVYKSLLYTRIPIKVNIFKPIKVIKKTLISYYPLY